MAGGWVKVFEHEHSTLPDYYLYGKKRRRPFIVIYATFDSHPRRWAVDVHVAAVAKGGSSVEFTIAENLASVATAKAAAERWLASICSLATVSGPP